MILGADPEPDQLLDHRGCARPDRGRARGSGSQTVWLVSALYLATAIGQPSSDGWWTLYGPAAALPRRDRTDRSRRSPRRPRPESRRTGRRPGAARVRHVRRLSRRDVPDPQRGPPHRAGQPGRRADRACVATQTVAVDRPDPRRPADRPRRLARQLRRQHPAAVACLVLGARRLPDAPRPRPAPAGARPARPRRHPAVRRDARLAAAVPDEPAGRFTSVAARAHGRRGRPASAVGAAARGAVHRPAGPRRQRPAAGHVRPRGSCRTSRTPSSTGSPSGWRAAAG